MNLYLVQHGEAVIKEVDPVRPLSEQGRRDVDKVAQFVARNGEVKVNHLYYSGKLRARQTAEIIAAALNIPPPVQSDGLAPLDDPLPWAVQLDEGGEDTMLVGHLPHLGKLAGVLLCDDAEAEPVLFRMGGMVALQGDAGVWALRWMVIPDIIPQVLAQS